MNQTMGLRNMSDSGYGGGHFGIWYSNPAMGECKGAGMTQLSTIRLDFNTHDAIQRAFVGTTSTL